MALLMKPGLVSDGDVVEVDIKGRLRKAEVTGWPFYDSEKYGASRSE